MCVPHVSLHPRLCTQEEQNSVGQLTEFLGEKVSLVQGLATEKTGMTLLFFCTLICNAPAIVIRTSACLFLHPQ